MTYHEIIITVLLNEDIPMEKSYEIISRFISRAMLGDHLLKELHEQKGYKHYVLCSLYPLESDKIYRKGRIYAFNLRGLDVNFILKMKRLIMTVQEGPMKAITAEIRQQHYRPIREIYTLTPAVATINGKSWTREDGIGLLMERIHINAIKKHRSFYGDLQEPAENFIEVIEQTNDKPIRIRYKNTSLLGCKLNLIVKQDELSQRLAFTVMGSGLLEKNTICCGYCRAK